MKGCTGPFKSDIVALDYEEDEFETCQASSPRSQELRDFDNYNRTNLPLLVEANFRAIVDPQIAPIEEHVRALVVDLVRICQSTVARNFQLTIASASLANDRTESSNQTIASTESAVQTDGEPIQTFGDGTAGLDFFREPPHVNAEASTLLPGPVHNNGSVTGSQDPNSDSGYSSLPWSCSCFCHRHSNPPNTANGKKLSTCASESTANAVEKATLVVTSANIIIWITMICSVILTAWTLATFLTNLTGMMIETGQGLDRHNGKVFEPGTDNCPVSLIIKTAFLQLHTTAVEANGSTFTVMIIASRNITQTALCVPARADEYAPSDLIQFLNIHPFSSDSRDRRQPIIQIPWLLHSHFNLEATCSNTFNVTSPVL